VIEVVTRMKPIKEKNKKVLLVANAVSMIKLFLMDSIDLLIEMGYEVEIACNFDTGSTIDRDSKNLFVELLSEKKIKYYNICFERNVMRVSQNIKAIYELINVTKKGDYSFIHCHTPIGGLAGRIAGACSKTKVIYTVHGFHFYKGAPLKNWLIYYPIEKICSYFTDILVTMNQEDYLRAKTRMHARHTYLIPGIGVNNKAYCPCDDKTKRDSIRMKYGVPKDKFWLLNVGELIYRKNQKKIIEAITEIDNVYFTIAGIGPERDTISKYVERLGITGRVKLLGFVENVVELYQGCDLFVFSSFQEGMPRAVLEAMACGKPVLASDIRGNNELISDGDGGYLFNPNDANDLKNKIVKLLDSDMTEMGNYNLTIIKKYSSEQVLNKQREIYQNMG